MKIVYSKWRKGTASVSVFLDKYLLSVKSLQKISVLAIMKTMKKNIQYLFSEEKWIAYTLVGVFFLLLCHMLLFFGHQFFVYRYDTLYDEATKEGAVVIMPDGFQEAR